ncbi:ADP-ribosylation factor-like protein 16 [Nilaparvata lugens]|uniref:ADP-ribosylation factor-like protein 16 n=1 Tax=Nilaparvata lugens TaxID=108931 RepID=UPI00193EBCEF|nr:ADP-ribosylation factor-like protein 16 [Nilaparvata lugens]
MSQTDPNKLQATVLCLGPPGSGKTLLLKKLQSGNSVDETSSSVATVGIDLITLRYQENQKNKAIVIREIGGLMAPIWNRYYDGINKVMFVIDTSNLCQISAAGVLFYTILAEPLLQKIKILMVLTKMDVSYRQMRNEALLMLQSKRLRKEAQQSITVVEASAVDGEGTEMILDWLKNKEINTKL